MARHKNNDLDECIECGDLTGDHCFYCDDPICDFCADDHIEEQHGEAEDE